MRLFTILSTRPSVGTLPDGSPTPALPQHSSIPVSQVAAITLTAQVSPQDANQVVAQTVTVQIVGGGAVPVFRNLAPQNPVQRAAIEAVFNQLRMDLLDETIPDVQRFYSEVS